LRIEMSVFSPLKIGSLELPINLVQGPLAGYSCAPFRELIESFVPIGYTTTEMISAYNLAHQIEQPRRYLYRGDSERRVCYQISGNDPAILAAATARVVELGADMVDLNCGCPQKKIRKKGCGTKLLADAEHLYQCVSAMRTASKKPLSVKIRVDGDSDEQFNQEVLTAIESAGADVLVVHGRHWRERYDVPVRADEIAQLVTMTSLPVIANGDVNSLQSAQRLLTQTGAAGVMVSRASIGRPWLFAEMLAQAQGKTFSPPTESQLQQLYQRHLSGLVALDGQYKAELQSRKLQGYYFSVA
jgi:tRNA-dihydrouridine synthase B